MDKAFMDLVDRVAEKMMEAPADERIVLSAVILARVSILSSVQGTAIPEADRPRTEADLAKHLVRAAASFLTR